MSDLRAPPPFLVDVSSIPGIELEIAYASERNFTGGPLPGYGAPGAWLCPPAAEALARAAASFARLHLRLRIYDAYRPVRASEAMWEWAVETSQTHLFDEGWIARKSRHNTGFAVDLVPVDRTGAALDMGSPFDAFDARSAFDGVRGLALERRRTLRQVMMDAGFRPYDLEWWHFEVPFHPAPRFDVPYGVAEPDPIRAVLV